MRFIYKEVFCCVKCKKKMDHRDAFELRICADASPTNLSLTLKGGDGFVSAIAKNEFTLFPSTVYVIVELYCSETEPSGYEEMTLIAKVSQVDLNMGNTTEARAGTGGVQKYWMGRMRYKIDGNNWDERVTPIGLFSAEGESITIV